MAARVTLRPGTRDDMPALLDLWVEAWTRAMPEIDFASRREWLQERLAKMVADGAVLTVAVTEGSAIGFSLVDPFTAYLDQIVVAPSHWSGGAARQLLDHARRLCPGGLGLHVNRQNGRAIRFYEREGFIRTGEGVNPASGLPIYSYQWTPSRGREASSPN